MCMNPRLRLSMSFSADVQQIQELQEAVAVAGLLRRERENTDPSHLQLALHNVFCAVVPEQIDIHNGRSWHSTGSRELGRKRIKCGEMETVADIPESPSGVLAVHFSMSDTVARQQRGTWLYPGAIPEQSVSVASGQGLIRTVGFIRVVADGIGMDGTTAEK
ncbi:unnamed protein product [Leuciscus chuanchicus]